MLEDWLKELLAEMKQGLERLYGDRFKGLYLFGSREFAKTGVRTTKSPGAKRRSGRMPHGAGEP